MVYQLDRRSILELSPLLGLVGARNSQRRINADREQLAGRLALHADGQMIGDPRVDEMGHRRELDDVHDRVLGRVVDEIVAWDTEWLCKSSRESEAAKAEHGAVVRVLLVDLAHRGVVEDVVVAIVVELDVPHAPTGAP